MIIQKSGMIPKWVLTPGVLFAIWPSPVSVTYETYTQPFTWHCASTRNGYYGLGWDPGHKKARSDSLMHGRGGDKELQAKVHVTGELEVYTVPIL